MTAPALAESPAEHVIRPVELADLPAWWQLRLRALREHPDMFGSAVEEQAPRTMDEVERSYRERSIAGDNRLFAAFTAENVPVATLGLVRLEGRKERHRALIWGVYTAPEARRRGLSTRLLAEAIAYCQTLPGVRQIQLNVSSHNRPAIRMYERAGFVRYGREPRALWLPDGPVDEDLMVRFFDDYCLSRVRVCCRPTSDVVEGPNVTETTAPTKRPTPDDFTNAAWEEILPRYEDLAARPLTPGDDAAIEAWLADWSALESALGEAGTLARIAYSADTADPAKEAANLRFMGEIGPRSDEQQVRLANKLLDTGYSRDDLATTLRRFRTDRDIFRDENVPLEQELQGLNAQYQKLTGGMTAEWDGQTIPLPRLAPHLLSPDRDVRERAFRLGFAPYIAEREALANLFDRQLDLRQRVARNAGFANYRDYVFAAKHRYDYTPADCDAFHEAVAATFVPTLAKRREARRQEMGLETLRPWDTAPDPRGRPALKPYETVDELTGGAEVIFTHVDPVFGGYFETMRDESLLDLESRRGKRPGGFCATLSYRKRPFILMNAAGVAGDVRTLLHESGHAFHAFEAGALPFIFQRHPGSEMAEVASMSMELLSAPYLRADDGGYYDSADYARARVEHLDGILALMPWVATVDAFQQWLYADPAGADREARDAKWIEIWRRFDPGVDWTGAEAERIARWSRQLHIFLYPFYYIEYGIAQLGALQVWRNSLRDQAQAVADYRAALALGGSRPLPDLFEAAGARLIFDRAGMAELVGLIEEQIAAHSA